MDIKAISTLTLPQNNYVPTPKVQTNAQPAQSPAVKNADTSKPETAAAQTPPANKTPKNFKKAIPYVAGAVVLAGLGIYIAKGKGKNLFSKKNLNEIKDDVADIGKKAKEEIKEEIQTSTKKVETDAAAAAKTETAAAKAETKTAEAAKEKAETAANAEAKPAEAAKDKAETAANAEAKPAEAAKDKAETAANAEAKPAEAAKDKAETAANAEAKPAEAAKEKAETAANAEAKPAEIAKDKAEAPKDKTEKTAKSKSKTSKASKTDAAKAENKPAEAAKQNAKAEQASVEEIKKSINLTNKETLDKVNKINADSSQEVNKIIGENSRDGHVDLDQMRDSAGQFCADKDRGDNRFHQAANLLEQSYIREAIKTEGKEKTGISYLHGIITGDKDLYTIYTHMPLEEAAVRVNNIRTKELANCKVENNITPDKLFDDVLTKIIENAEKKA